MRFLKPLATTALSFAFLCAGAYAQNTQQSQSTTQNTTSTDAYGNTQSTTQHKAKSSDQTTLPDGTVVNRQHKSDATRYDANGNPIVDQHSTSNSQDTVTPDGTQTRTETQTHTETGTTPTTPPPAPPQK
ncbi:MAG TPA: hypothetical protein VGM11_13720 [Acidobacteriaceae bacterium]|jgi:hypothetical protein